MSFGLSVLVARGERTAAIRLANTRLVVLAANVSSPPVTLNVTGPELLCVRELCLQFGKLMHNKVEFNGVESPTALLNNASKALKLFGSPLISAEQMIRWTADWVRRGQPTLG